MNTVPNDWIAQGIVEEHIPTDSHVNKSKLKEAIRVALEAAQARAQSWRPIELKGEFGPASVKLHCTEQGTEIQAYNPIRNEWCSLPLEPLRKPVQSEGSNAVQARKVGR